MAAGQRNASRIGRRRVFTQERHTGASTLGAGVRGEGARSDFERTRVALARKKGVDPLPTTPAKKKDGPEPKRPPVLALMPSYMEGVFAGMKADLRGSHSVRSRRFAPQKYSVA